MGTKITVTIIADTSKLEAALERLAERVESGDHELVDVDGARQALRDVVPSWACSLLPDGYAAWLAELAQIAEDRERERAERQWREHVGGADVDPLPR